jgi:hypothetical protein
MRILHLAHGPMQKVPLHFLEMERRAGHQSDIVFFQGPADTSQWPTIPWALFDYAPIRAYRAWKLKARVAESNRRLVRPGPGDRKAPARPLSLIKRGPLEALWYPLKDALIRRRIPAIIREFKLAGYDAVHFDGARDLNWSADLARALKAGGAKIVSVFYGTELRVEGVTPALDALSDLNLSVESDHVYLHPDIHFVYAPFELAAEKAPRPAGGPVRIVHAPSHRYNKGTDLILPVIERLKRRFDFEFVLVEGLTQDECRKVKYTCDLCIDQVGNRGGTGYGISSLEMFAAGIPCLSDFTDFLSDSLPGHPFYLATPETLETVLAGILSDPRELAERGARSRSWLAETHGYAAVRPRMRELYARLGLEY